LGRYAAQKRPEQRPEYWATGTSRVYGKHHNAKNAHL
jgi:hypothetical protein